MISSKKKECPRCHKIFRLKCFKYNRVLKEIVCNLCNRQVGSNIWYIPKEDRKREFVGKYNYSREEKQQLFRNLTSQGISQSEANRKINGDLKYLRNKKVRDKFQRKQEIVINNLTIKNEKEQKEKLLVGLK